MGGWMDACINYINMFLLLYKERSRNETEHKYINSRIKCQQGEKIKDKRTWQRFRRHAMKITCYFMAT